jgi:hypothetical protein
VINDGVFDALRNAWRKECAAATSAPAEVWFCHRTGPDEERFEWMAGVRALGWHLAQHKLMGIPQVPVLLVGEHPLKELRQWAAEIDLPLGELLKWPGVAYLPFGATRSQVVAACERAAAGSATPIPPALIDCLAMHVRKVLVASLHVRHWLANRLKAARLSVAQLHAAESVDRNYLKPQEAMSSEHREMVVSLVTLASSPGLPPETDASLRQFRDALASYERAWAAIEARRAELASAPEVDSVREHAAKSFKEEMARIASVIEEVIASTLELDKALASGRK